MATIRAIIRAAKKSRATIYFRLTDGRGIKIYYKSELVVDPRCWDEKNQEIKVQKFNTYTQEERAKLKKDIAEASDVVFKVYNSSADKANFSSELLQEGVNRELHPERYVVKEELPKTFFDFFDDFLKVHKLSVGRKRHFEVVKRALMRYELYRNCQLDLNTLSPDTLRDIEKYLRDEPKVYKERPDIFEVVEESRKPQPRGQNTINGILTKIRTFVLWANEEELTNNNPFKKFKIEQSVYGTPYFLSREEIVLLYQKDLSARPQLAIQRDIFVFQCQVGCRVGDFLKMTRTNLKNNGEFIEYIAGKTIEERPTVVRVPLNTIAKEILSRYPECEEDKLLPFISEQNYNISIKEMLTLAEITRMVTVVNPTTGEPDNQPIDKIASSHLARRCFVGNLYNKVKDPNLIGELTGHVPGSKSFNRYKSSSDEMKNELVKMLE